MKRKKNGKKVLAAVCCLALLAVGAGLALAQDPAPAGEVPEISIADQVPEVSAEEQVLEESDAGQRPGGSAADQSQSASAEEPSQETSASLPGGVVVGYVDKDGQPHLSGAQETPVGPGYVQYESASEADQAGEEAGAEADGTAEAGEFTLVWGPVESVAEGEIAFDNQSGHSMAGTIVLHFDPAAALIVEGVSGYPVQPGDIKAGDVIYAYIGPAMTMSLPPQTNPQIIICQVPADAKAPAYVKVESMTAGADGSYVMTGDAGVPYTVPADCEIQPYLTRNIVTLADVTAGRRCLVWADDAGTARKIVLFAAE